LLEPAGRLAHLTPVRHGRDECPFRAACFRRVLPRVVGFPHRRVLRSIRLPNRIRRAFPLPVLLRLPCTWCVAARRFQHCSVSGFPLLCLKSCIPYPVASPVQELLGSPKFFNVSLPACHGLRTPADLSILAHNGWSCVAFGVRENPRRPQQAPFRSCTSTSGDTAPPTAYRILCLRFAHFVRCKLPCDSAMDARLDTGGWRALTRQGLSPC
jgi:hypothetical protein